MGGRKLAFFGMLKIGVFQINILNSTAFWRRAKQNKNMEVDCYSFIAVSYELQKSKVHCAYYAFTYTVMRDKQSVPSPKVHIIISTLNTVRSLDDSSVSRSYFGRLLTTLIDRILSQLYLTLCLCLSFSSGHTVPIS